MNTNDAKLAELLPKFGIDPDFAYDGFRAAHPFPVAVRLAMLGFRVLPTRVQSKIPCVKGWPERATTDPAKLAMWQAQFNSNWSVLTGRENGVVVIDVDGERGRADLARLESELGALPRTWRCNSGRTNGGFHVWLRPPPGADDLRNQQPLPGYKIDIRGFHGHIVISGSLHSSGTRYAWADGCSPGEIELAECPAAWWEWLPKKDEAIAASRSKSQPSARRGSSPGNSRRRSPASLIIGDGPDGGGFNRPIRVRCCQFWTFEGAETRVTEFKEVLRSVILSANASNHTEEQIARYASDDYLDAELASARDWINSQAKSNSTND